MPFADTKGKRPPRHSQIGGLELWETEVAGVTVPSRVGSTDFRVEASGAKIATSGQGGLFEPKQDS